MTAEELYHLIHGLPPEEKAKVSRFLALISGGGKPAYSVLFEKLSGRPEWNSIVEKDLRKGYFEKPDTYYQTREILLDKIISALSDPIGDIPKKRYITKSVELNAIHLAKKVMMAAIENAMIAEEFFEALQYLRLNQEVYELNGIMLFDDQESALMRKVKAACEADIFLAEWYEKVKGFLQYDFSEWDRIAREVEGGVNGIVVHSRRQEFQKERIRSRALFFKGEYRKALINQQELILRFKEEEIPVGLWIQEISLLIQLYGDNNQGDKATYWTLQLGKLPISTPRDSIFLKRMWVKNAVLISDRFYRYDLSKMAIQMIESHPGLIKTGAQATALHSGVLVAFANEEFSHALELIGRIKRIPKKNRAHITWQPYILKVIILHAMGEDLEAALKSAKRFLEKQKRQFPWYLLRIVKELHKSSLPISQPMVEQWMNELGELLTDPDELGCSCYFDAPLWLQSHLSGKSMALESKNLLQPGTQPRNAVGFI